MALSCILRGMVKQIKVNPSSEILKANIRPLSCLLHKNIYQDQKPINWNSKQLVPLVKQFSTTSICKASHGDHSKVWTAERFLAGGLLGIIPAALLVPSQPLDILMALSVVMHMHWGIEAIVVDYVRPSIFGNVIPKIGVLLVYALSIGTLAGLLNFIFNDVGLANGVRMFWNL
uniref:Succinate dehydrogenase [ubiquinone] cytochrome b small subunit n=1 Tax=Clastoptera arizonana TaxID=38151 RepID=A0A1B6D8P8_9HEMI